ncbi:hypothetical protein GCM10022409_43120 [Hymenobacter glaciei]|uniref:Histidine kinase domain-containing protein n=1 Tax=Hymenobacter glaciei TaxID=877209 RepID=A0ABP7USG5_9BACT
MNFCRQLLRVGAAALLLCLAPTARAQPSPRVRVLALLATGRATVDTDTAASRRAAQQAYALARAAGLDTLAVRAQVCIGMSATKAPGREAWAMVHLQAARVEARRLGLTDELARTYYGQGCVEGNRHQFAASESALLTGLGLWRQLGNAQGMINVYNELGMSSRSAGRYPEAMRAHFKALRLADSTHDERSQIMALRNMGSLSQMLDDMPSAVTYTDRALKLLLAQPRRDTIALVGTEAALGLFLQEQNRYPLARQHLLAGIRLGEHLRSPAARVQLGYLVYGLGEIAYEQHDYPASLTYYQRAERLFGQTAQPTSQVSALNGLALAQQRLGQSGAALRSARQALAISIGLKSPYNLAGTYGDFAALSAMQHDYAAAYRYQLRNQELNDSLLMADKARELTALNARYQAEQKETQIKLLRGQAALQQADARWQHGTRNLFGLALLLALAAGGTFYHRYRLQRRTSEQLTLAQQQAQARNQELELVQQQLRRSLGDKEVLLKEVHHRVKNNLQIVSSLLALQAHAQAKLPDVVGALREGQNWVKSIALAHELLYQAEDLAQVDFQQFAEQLAKHLRSAFAVPTARVVVQATGIRLGTDTAVPLGLIVNELLSNSFKYACAGGRACTVTVTLIEVPVTGYYRLTMADDGPGLPTGFVLAQASSLGLRLVQSLAQQLGGEAYLSAPGRSGTEVVITFPVLQ